MGEAKSIRVSYRVNESLFAEAIALASQRATRVRSPSERSIWIPPLIVILFAAASARVRSDLLQLDMITWVFLGAVLISLALSFFLSRGQLLERAARNILETKMFAGDVNLEIDASGMSFRIGQATGLVPWPTVDEARRMTNGLAIHYGGFALPIPADALREGITVDILHDRIEQWRKGAREE